MTASVARVPEGMRFDDVRGLLIEGMVARDMENHPVMTRPNRHFATCTFDHLSGNTMLGMHLARIEPNGFKCRHRHFDETVAFVVSGFGRGEFRQADDGPAVVVEWKRGDLVVIPSNSWHQHLNGSNTDFARQLSFRTSRLMNTIVHGTTEEYHASENLYNSNARFYDRFADEPDYFEIREEVRPGLVKTNHVRSVVDEPLPAPDPAWGHRVALQHYSMGGQRLLDLVLVGIGGGGHMRAQRSMAEEGFVVLAGSGRTKMWDETGREVTVEWSEGDLVSPPLGSWRSHHAGSSEVRFLLARNAVLERALGHTVGTIADMETFPSRLMDRLEAGSS